ncbi:hypothetical protein [Vibrio nigripulchritudo]|uniref:hypothetical protein n=1 Tax=Vibrio nigripulchritudo TaxID=28173 RepID=UPI0012DA6845|nr:hypothetical protein [Vibrio nigripulchritudo]
MMRKNGSDLRHSGLNPDDVVVELGHHACNWTAVGGAADGDGGITGEIHRCTNVGVENVAVVK